MPSASQLVLHRGNRLDVLARTLGEVLHRSGRSPLQRAFVVVPNPGFGLWLRTEVARAEGIAAHLEFSYPRAAMRGLLERVVGEPARDLARFERRPLSLVVWSALDDLARLPGFDLVRSYLEGSVYAVPRRSYGLARTVADAFDQALTYRPELVLGWDRGEHLPLASARSTDPSREVPAWLVATWRRVTNALGHNHLATVSAMAFERLQASHAGDLSPEPIYVFGVVGVPPLYLRLLVALSRHRPVHLFVPTPSPSYLADLAGTDGYAPVMGPPPNRLLSLFGGAYSTFQRLLDDELSRLGLSEQDGDDRAFVRPTGDHALGVLAQDVFDVSHRSRRPESLEPAPLAPDDRSIEIHACHSPLREIEVLRDRLLARFAADETLRPEDVLIIVADLPTYLPFIRAVFDTHTPGLAPLPYHLADPTPASEVPALATFLRVLGLVDDRVTWAQVHDLLHDPALQATFALTSDDLDVLERWTYEAGIRWGIDEPHRSLLGRPGHDDNTWRRGLDRLLLGVALPGQDHGVFEGLFGFDDVEGSQADLLGRFVEFCDALFSALSSFRQPKPLLAWPPALRDLATKLFGGAPAHFAARLEEALSSLVEETHGLPLDTPIPIALVARHLEEIFTERARSHSTAIGGVTFASLVPRLGVPFRIIALIGLSDGAFPRPAPHSELDPTRHAPRLGDRNLREDDHHALVEAILAARDAFLATYLGRSMKDDSVLPPCNALSELLSVLGDSFDVAAWPRFVTEHPLQAFSVRAFDPADERRASFDTLAWTGAVALASDAPKQETAFIDAPLPPVPAVPHLELDDVVRYVTEPVRTFFRKRLSLSIPGDENHFDEDDPLELDPLETYKSHQAFLAPSQAQATPLQIASELHAQGRLPPATLGVVKAEQLMRTAAAIEALAAPLRGSTSRAVRIAVSLPRRPLLRGQVLVTGISGPLEVTAGRLNAKRLLTVWTRHLAVTAMQGPKATCETVLIGRAEDGDDRGPCRLRFRPVPAPGPYMEAIVDAALEAAVSPLPWFPGAGLIYARTLRKHGDPHKAAAAAQKSLEKSTDGIRKEEAAIQRAFGSHDLSLVRPFGHDTAADTLVRLSDAIFGPLLDHLEHLDASSAEDDST